MSTLLPGFKTRKVRTSGATIHLEQGGSGTPVLLLHGYPESHVMWHKIAPDLARDHAVVCPDLRGYGDSSKAPGLPDHSNYSKRAMAQDMAEVMSALGHERFHVVEGQDRIASGIAAALPRQPEFGLTLVRVAKTSGGRIELTFKKGNTTVVKTHDHAVLAIPFTVLRQVVLEPSLCEDVHTKALIFARRRRRQPCQKRPTS